MVIAAFCRGVCLCKPLPLLVVSTSEVGDDRAGSETFSIIGKGGIQHRLARKARLVPLV